MKKQPGCKVKKNKDSSSSSSHSHSHSHSHMRHHSVSAPLLDSVCDLASHPPKETSSGVLRTCTKQDAAECHQDRNSDIMVHDRYQLKDCLGKGSFGRIYRMHDMLTGLDVAAKFEHTSMKHPQVLYENKIYNIVMGHSNIPNVHASFTEGEYNILVMDMLGASLEDLLKERHNSVFSLQTVLLIARQLINVLQHLHDCDFVHRDVKPENFLMGKEHTAPVVYLIDMGLVKRFRHNNSHIVRRQNKPLVGTVRYASLDTHRGIEQSRKDDMESLGYMLVYLLKGSLPWQDVGADSIAEKYDKIHRIKETTTLEELCTGLPDAFCSYLQLCRNTQFHERPDYIRMRQLFSELADQHGFCCSDNEYDWS